jgi:hypothetical protein
MSIVDKVPKAPSTVKPVVSPSAEKGSSQGKMHVSSPRKDETRPKFPPQYSARDSFALDNVDLNLSKNEDDAMESEAQATGVRPRKRDRTSLTNESLFGSKDVDVAKRRNGNQISPRQSSLRIMDAVPCCKACQKETSGATSNRAHHALCPKNPQFTNSGAREKLEFIRCGIKLGCKACTFHYKYGRAAPQNQAHVEACRRRKVRQREELRRVESEAKIRNPSCNPSNRNSSVKYVEVEATVDEPAPIAPKQIAASTSRTKKRKSGVLREKSNMIDRITNPEKNTSRKILSQETESQPDDIAVPTPGREKNDRSSKKCRYEFKSDTDSEEDINRKQTKRNVTAKQNNSSSSRGAPIPLVVETSRKKVSLVTPSAPSASSVTAQKRKTKPAQSTASAGRATNVEATAGHSKPNWILCTNPWGPSGFVEGDVVLTSPSGGFSHHETMYGGERFVVSPFHSQSDYITTHRTPSEGFEVLQLTRDPMAQLPWGFTYRRHEFGGACLVASVDPLSSAASAVRFNYFVSCRGSFFYDSHRFFFSRDFLKQVYRGNESEPTPGLGLRLHDMILSMNGKSIGGMTELGAGIELDVCGRHLELVVSRYKNRVGATRQLVTKERHERESFYDAINDRSRLDWYEVNPHSGNAFNVDMQQASDMTPLDPLDSQGSLRDSFDFRAIDDSQQDPSAEGNSVTPAAIEQVGMSPNKTRGLEQFSLSQISLTSPNSLVSYQDEGGSEKAKTKEIDGDESHTENCTDDDNDDNCCLGCVCGEIHPEPIRVFWIQCDDCHSWYNVASLCAGFTESEVSSSGRWLCRACDDTVDDQSSVESNSEQSIAVLKKPSRSEALECFTNQEHDPPSRRGKPNDKHMRYIPRTSSESTSSTSKDENEQFLRSESFIGSNRKTVGAHNSEKLLSRSRVDREVRRTDDEDVLPSLKPNNTVNVQPSDMNGSSQEKPILLPVGTLVSVAKRDWAGSGNKEGGVGTIVDARAADDGTDTMYYEVSYSLGGREKFIDWQYVTAYQFPGRRNARPVQRCEGLGVVPEPAGHAQRHGGFKNSASKEPKKTEDGLFQRPVGNSRKGMDCDSKRGIWVPLSNPDLARDSSIEETAQDTSDKMPRENARKKEESVNKEAKEAQVSVQVPRIASTDAASAYQGTKRNLMAGGQRPAKENDRKENCAFIQSLEELINKVERAHLNAGRSRAQRTYVGFTTMTEEMLRLAIRVWRMIPGKCGSVQEASAYLEEVDASAYRIEKFLIGDPGMVLYSTQHRETEVALSEWLKNKEIDLCENKFRVNCRKENEIHDDDSVTWASNYDSLKLDSEAKGEERITECDIEKEANPHERPKILSEGYWGRIDREGRRREDGCILPNSEPKKVGDGTYAQPKHKAPRGFVWDPSRGLYVPESMEVKAASIALRIKYDALGAAKKPKGKSTNEGLERSAPRVLKDVCATANVLPAAQCSSVDHEGRGTQDGYILPESVPEKAAVAIHVQCDGLRATMTPLDKPKLLSASSSSRSASKASAKKRDNFQGRRTEDGCILPSSEPKKAGDGAYAQPKHKAPHGFVWDPSRGLYAPESMEEKAASIALGIKYDALGAAKKPKGNSTNEGLERSAPRVLEDVCATANVLPAAQCSSVDHEGRGTQDGYILPESVPEKAANATYARPRGKSPICMKWDYSRGVWVHKYNRKSKAKAVSSEESEPRLLDKVCETADASPKDTNDTKDEHRKLRQSAHWSVWRSEIGKRVTKMETSEL